MITNIKIVFSLIHNSFKKGHDLRVRYRWIKSHLITLKRHQAEVIHMMSEMKALGQDSVSRVYSHSINSLNS